MQFDRRQRQLLGDLLILDGASIIGRLSFDPFGGQTAAGDRRSAAERLEFGVDDLSVLINL